jgi:hypothetical protein
MKNLEDGLVSYDVTQLAEQVIGGEGVNVEPCVLVDMV